jgi:phosphopantothenoylcysteine synthetase/decarboxylase
MDELPLVVVATGSSASIILTAYLTELRAELEHELCVVMTRSAERFVRPEVVGWFADRVLTVDTPQVNPIEVALTARAIVVLPASGNTIASAALGILPTLATTVIAAAPSPSLYFPHMNGAIWSKPFMRRHVDTLRARADTVVEPKETSDYEIWRRAKHVGLSMPEPDEAAAIVSAWLDEGASASMVEALDSERSR